MPKFFAALSISLAAVITLGASGGVANAPAARVASATTVVLTFSELPFQPVNGLHYKGLRFGFKVGGVASTDAHYHGFGPGQGKYVQDPSLEGNASGTLILTFDKSTRKLQFGVARSTGATLTPGCVIKLYDSAGHLIGTFKVTTKVIPPFHFSEALFKYPGATAVKTAVITYPSTATAARFALDNLTYQT